MSDFKPQQPEDHQLMGMVWAVEGTSEVGAVPSVAIRGRQVHTRSLGCAHLRCLHMRHALLKP